MYLKSHGFQLMREEISKNNKTGMSQGTALNQFH